MTSRPFKVNPVLTALVVGYRNQAITLIADAVLPRIPTAEKFAWTRHAIAEAFTVPDGRVGRRGKVARVEFTSEQVDDGTADFGWEDSVPRSDIRAAAAARAAGLSIADPEARATTGLADIKVLAREIRVANKVFSAASYDPSMRIALSGSSMFSDPTSDPIGVVNDGLEACLVRPNKMVFGQGGWAVFRRHPKIVKACRNSFSGEGMVTREEVATLFEVQSVEVGASRINAAKKGQPLNLARTWGNHLALLHINPQGGIGEGAMPTFGFTADASGGGVAMDFEDPDVGLYGGQTIRVGEQVKEIVSATGCGYFIQNAF
ncbi:MAG: capsid protein [Siculibacillus sp.]